MENTKSTWSNEREQEESLREKLKREEQEWRQAGYPVEKARQLEESYSSYFSTCYGPDEDDEPDEFGLYRHNDAVQRGSDYELAYRFFALAQEMALRYLSREFRWILKYAFGTAKSFAWYEGYYCREVKREEKLEKFEREYEECCEREKQARKRRQENLGLSEEYCKACVELLAILKQASREEMEKIPKKLLDFFERSCDPYYVFTPGKGEEIKDMKLRKETKGLLAMIYRNYWCAAEQRREYDRLLAENDRKCRELGLLEGGESDGKTGRNIGLHKEGKATDREADRNSGLYQGSEEAGKVERDEDEAERELDEISRRLDEEMRQLEELFAD
ncbi:MAG: hypothetical protein NC432_14785 [Roseburia sp.]|nr:hypothetical protein [Roseburia sp.]MCM1099671.1 hypothetical protein [Ruminococcus flavefaciens]